MTTATLRVSCRAYERPDGRRRNTRGDAPAPDLCNSWELLSGMTVEVTGREDEDESEVIMRDGTAAWLQTRFL